MENEFYPNNEQQEAQDRLPEEYMSDTEPTGFEAPEEEAPVFEAPEAEAPVYEAPKAETNPYYFRAPQMDNGWQPPRPEPVRSEPERPQPEQPKRKKNKNLGLKIAAVAVICALVGGIGGGALVGSILSKQMKKTQAQWEKSFSEVQTQVSQQGTTEATTPILRPVVDTEGMTPAEVYSRNVSAVVGILNQSTSTGRNIFGQPITSNTASSGTGFIISEDGEILTNYHVVEGANTLTVTLFDGNEYNATVLGYESESDVALIKIDGKDLPTVKLGSSEALTVGSQVAAIGNPLGELTYSMTVGYVSAMDRAVNTDGTPINMMQIDAAINSGNSGGPLFNMFGEVVGINTAKYSGSTSSGTSIEGIGFAIPIDDVLSILEDLRTNGSVTDRAYIGISVGDVDSATAEAYGLPMGALVSNVDEGTCGARAGLQKSDIITAVDDYKITSRDELSSALKHYRAGDNATLLIYRAGRYLKLQVTFDARPSANEATTDVPEATTPADGGTDPNGGSGDYYDFFGGNGGSGTSPFDFFYGWPFG